VPTAQLAQTDEAAAPVVVENEPDGQLAQLDAPVDDMYLAAAHGVHVVAPEAAAYRPTALFEEETSKRFSCERSPWSFDVFFLKKYKKE
jgi:hypothetical protein